MRYFIVIISLILILVACDKSASTLSYDSVEDVAVEPSGSYDIDETEENTEESNDEDYDTEVVKTSKIKLIEGGVKAPAKIIEPSGNGCEDYRYKDYFYIDTLGVTMTLTLTLRDTLNSISSNKPELVTCSNLVRVDSTHYTFKCAATDSLRAKSIKFIATNNRAIQKTKPCKCVGKFNGHFFGTQTWGFYRERYYQHLPLTNEVHFQDTAHYVPQLGDFFTFSNNDSTAKIGTVYATKKLAATSKYPIERYNVKWSEWNTNCRASRKRKSVTCTQAEFSSKLICSDKVNKLKFISR